MLATAGTMSILLALNVIFALVALAVGFVAGAWFGGSRQMSCADGHGSELSAERERQRQIERERAAMATDRLRDLAGGVAADVGEHSAVVGEITAKLRTLDTSDVEATGAGLVDALSKIVAANETLQAKLDKAEEQIEAQAREIRLHESEARTDSLTGLANRRAFDDEMKRRYAEATRRGMPLSLLILDIDFFKKFNDAHGHQAGDAVLRSVADTLVETCREMDLPCRYGGEEFAIVMPATTVEEGTIAAERVRTAVESLVVEFEGKQLKVTTSIGLAQFASSDDTTRLIKRADEALYVSKNAGRNCGHYHDGNKFVPCGEIPNKDRGEDEEATDAESFTCALDGLSNRTKFVDELRRRMAESNRTEQAISVLVVDLQSYARIREQFGAEVGCAALDAVATVLKQSLRDMDLLARLSDSRFVAMLPGNSDDTALAVGHRASKTLKECPLELEGETVDLQLALGATQYVTGDTVEELVSRAEAQLAIAAEEVSGDLATR